MGNPLAYLPNELLYVLLFALPCDNTCLILERSDEICSYLAASAKARLAGTCKALYEKMQTPLYYHATVPSLKKFSAFIRTVTETAKYDKRGNIVGKEIKTLKIIIDPTTEEGNRATAVVLGRMISTIVM
jgi:hypothetical protein